MKKLGQLNFTRTITTSATKSKTQIVDVDNILDKTEKLFMKLTLNIKDIGKEKMVLNNNKTMEDKTDKPKSIFDDLPEDHFSDFDDF